MNDLGFDLRLFPPAGDLPLANSIPLKDHLGIPGQVIHGYAESVGQSDQHPGAEYRLVPFVPAERLRRHVPVNPPPC